MNKEMFLEELRGYLQILEDQEQDDIIEEYAQHIDMKLQKGLREEEAIRDFGPVKELAAEILEAYHVKPDFQKKKAAIKLPGQDCRQREKLFCAYLPAFRGKAAGSCGGHQERMALERRKMPGFGKTARLWKRECFWKAASL